MLLNSVSKKLSGNARKTFDHVMKEVAHMPSFSEMFHLDQLPLPLLDMEDMELYFATPGALIPGYPEMQGMGAKFKGKLYVDFMGHHRFIGETDNRLTLADGLKIYAHPGNFDVGPIHLENTTLTKGRYIIPGNLRRLHCGGCLTTIMRALRNAMKKGLRESTVSFVVLLEG